MLVLQRNLGQGITIINRQTGETIKLKMVRCTSPVRIGFEAGDDYLIMRDELMAGPMPAEPHSKESELRGVA